MASASTAKDKDIARAERRLAKLSARRLAAMHGEKTPLGPAEWVRFILRTLGILIGLLVSVFQCLVILLLVVFNHTFQR